MPRQLTRSALLAKHDALTQVALTIPVFLTYHVGVLTLDIRNGVDWVSMLTFGILGLGLGAYLVVTCGFAAGLLVAMRVLRRRGGFEPAGLVSIVVEGAVWALVMAYTVGHVVARLFGALAPAIRVHAASLEAHGTSLSPLAELVISAGAGFHEELVFRAALFGGGAWLLERAFAVRRALAVGTALLLSSATFSAVHYVGPLGDAFDLGSATFRFLLGLFLAGLFRYRGFAVAVYAHFLYDVFYFWIVA